MSTLVLAPARECALFRTLPSAAFNEVVRRSEIVQLKANDIIFKINEVGDFLYILLSGSVESKKDGLTTSTLKVGDIGGLTSLILEHDKNQTRSFTHVVVSENCKILKIKDSTFNHLLNTSMEFRTALYSFLAEKIRQKNVVLTNLLPAKTTPGNKIKIAVFDTKPYDIKYLSEGFSTCDKAELCFIQKKLTSETTNLASGASLVCIFVNDICDSRVVQQLKGLGVEHVLLRSAGFNNVDLKEAAKANIDVTRVPAYSPYAVAEHGFAMLQTLNRRTHIACNRVREHNFQLAGLEGFDLHGKKVGVLGTGLIGRCFASIANGYGMKMVFYDPFPDPKLISLYPGSRYITDLNEFFSQSEILSLHLPLNEKTRHFINAKTLAMLPKGAIVINVSRGPIINTEDLLQSLLSGHLGGACLDVYENEREYFFEDHSKSVILDNTLARLIGMHNVVITAHQAFLTCNALKAIASTVRKNFDEYLAGKRGSQLTNRVAPIVAKL